MADRLQQDAPGIQADGVLAVEQYENRAQQPQPGFRPLRVAAHPVKVFHHPAGQAHHAVVHIAAQWVRCRLALDKALRLGGGDPGVLAGAAGLHADNPAPGVAANAGHAAGHHHVGAVSGNRIGAQDGGPGLQHPVRQMSVYGLFPGDPGRRTGGGCCECRPAGGPAVPC